MKLKLDSWTYLDPEDNPRRVILYYDSDYIPPFGPYVMERWQMPVANDGKHQPWELVAESSLGRYDDAQRCWKGIGKLIQEKRKNALRNSRQIIEGVVVSEWRSEPKALPEKGSE